MLPATTQRLSHLIEVWRDPKGPRRIAVLVLIAALLSAIALLVYRQGGTQSVYPHLMYAPVLLAAFSFNIAGGIITALAAGLILGPLIPLNVAAEIPQDTAGWLLRTGFFVMVGALAGLACQVLNAQLDWLRGYAYYDPLTGLPNLLAMREHVQQLGARQSEGCMVVFSLANLAEIVNTLGYKQTEQLLQKLAQRLRQALPTATMVARVDSDKFAAMLLKQDCSSDAGLLAACRDLQETYLPMDEIPIHVEVSIGIAHLADSDDEPEALIPLAEIAAGRAHAERLGVAVYAEEQDTRNKANLHLLGELRRAIEVDQLVLHYQPKLELASGRVSGVEALVRWRHPRKGIILPGRFIPLAEHTALMKPLTHWVLESALRQLAEWQHSGFDLEVAINISTHNLSERNLLNRIVTLIETYGIRPEKLTLEITESALMYPSGETVRVLARLRDRGVKIAIDDFGTGYSSLAYLKRLPVTSLKIDRSFVTHLEDDRDRIIVQTAIDFGHHLDLEVVAEGVETKQALDVLRTMHCDLAQGNHISPPVPAERLAELR